MGQNSKCMNPLWQNYTNWKETFWNVFYTCHDSLILCLLYKIIGIYWSWNSGAENGLLDNLGAFMFVFIFITSWEGKHETDRLPNVFDLFKRYFAFILKSLKRIRDRCSEKTRTFIHILLFPFHKYWWTSAPGTVVDAAEAMIDQNDKVRVGDVASVFEEEKGGHWLRQNDLGEGMLGISLEGGWKTNRWADGSQAIIGLDFDSSRDEKLLQDFWQRLICKQDHPGFCFENTI